TAVLNDIIFVRVAGLFTGSGLTTSAIGQEIYTSDAGVITTTAGSWPRLVGRALNVSADADIWINPNLVVQPMLLTWGNGTGPAAGQTRYMNPTGYSTGAVSSSQVSFPAPFYGVISNLIISAATGPTVDNTVFTLNVNGADTALTATMAAGGVLAADYVNLAPVTLGGQVELKAVGGASVGAAATGLVACALFLPNKLTV
ncbi:MAG TPA: hypothetical protein VLV86_02265, partial [Vicinamibacterales bacterium]|nr:hypothetical protein [Vicinamibacterales bacterium]